MHDILGTFELICPGSRDVIKFWEICDNVSETVQDRDMVAMEN